MLDELLSEINPPMDIGTIREQISVPDMPNISLEDTSPKGKDIFKVEQRKAWDK